MTQSDSPDNEKRQVDIDWNIPADIATKYVTDAVIQQNEDTFIVSFFETQQPIGIRSTDEITLIRSNCVARFAVSPSDLQRIVNMLDNRLKTYWENGDESG